MNLDERIDHLARLRPGWMPGAPAIRPEFIALARPVLHRMIAAPLYSAWLVPTPTGGLQLEWGESEIELLDRGDHIMFLGIASDGAEIEAYAVEPAVAWVIAHAGANNDLHYVEAP